MDVPADDASVSLKKFYSSQFSSKIQIFWLFPPILYSDRQLSFHETPVTIKSLLHPILGL